MLKTKLGSVREGPVRPATGNGSLVGNSGLGDASVATALSKLSGSASSVHRRPETQLRNSFQGDWSKEIVNSKWTVNVSEQRVASLSLGIPRRILSVDRNIDKKADLFAWKMAFLDQRYVRMPSVCLYHARPPLPGGERRP